MTYFDGSARGEDRTGSMQFVSLPRLSSRPSVSVLIANYNYGHLIADAIDSALSQSYTPREVVVFDDGSTDSSCQVVNSYIARGEPVLLLRGQHRGMAAGLNAAFEAASGDILCFLDADDYFLPGKIESVVAAFLAHPNAGFAIHRAQRVDIEGRRRGIFPLLGSLPRGDCADIMVENQGILMGLPPTSNLSLRSQVAEHIFPIPEYLFGYAEQFLHRIAPFCTSICPIDESLSVWRLHTRNDANAEGVFPHRLRRELDFMERLWNEQRAFLVLHNPTVAPKLVPLNFNALYISMQYMLLRLTGDRAAREYHRMLCSLVAGGNWTIRWFWRMSVWLPLPFFKLCINKLQTQSIAKQWIAYTLCLLRFVRVRRTLVSACARLVAVSRVALKERVSCR